MQGRISVSNGSISLAFIECWSWGWKQRNRKGIWVGVDGSPARILVVVFSLWKHCLRWSRGSGDGRNISELGIVGWMVDQCSFESRPPIPSLNLWGCKLRSAAHFLERGLPAAVLAILPQYHDGCCVQLLKNRWGQERKSLEVGFSFRQA